MKNIIIRCIKKVNNKKNIIIKWLGGCIPSDIFWENLECYWKGYWEGYVNGRKSAVSDMENLIELGLYKIDGRRVVLLPRRDAKGRFTSNKPDNTKGKIEVTVGDGETLVSNGLCGFVKKDKTT